MRKSRFSEEQIIGILKEHQAGLPVAGLCRKHGINDGTFYACRSKFGGMETSDARRLKALEGENRKLKKLLAEQMLDAATPRESLAKKLLTPSSRRKNRDLGDRAEGRACRLVGIEPKTYRYRSHRPASAAVARRRQGGDVSATPACSSCCNGKGPQPTTSAVTSFMPRKG